MRPTSKATLPRLIRTLGFAWVAGWLSWQLLLIAFGAADQPSWIQLLLLLVLSIGACALALRQAARFGPPAWRPSDGLLIVFALMLLLFEVTQDRTSTEPPPVTVQNHPWSGADLSNAQQAEGRALEATWRELLWRESAWQVVVLFREQRAAYGSRESQLSLSGRLSGGAAAPRLSLELRQPGARKVLWNHSTGSMQKGSPDRLGESLQGLRVALGAGSLEALPGATERATAALILRIRRCQYAPANSSLQHLAALREDLATRPDDAARHVSLAACLLALGERQLLRGTAWRHEARASASRALRLVPEMRLAQIVRARLAWRLDQDAALAQQLWLDVLQAYPYHAGLRFELAEMLLATGATEAAAIQLELGLRNAPDHPLAMQLQEQLRPVIGTTTRQAP